jgi:hypothetical protein
MTGFSFASFFDYLVIARNPVYLVIANAVKQSVLAEILSVQIDSLRSQ